VGGSGDGGDGGKESEWVIKKKHDGEMWRAEKADGKTEEWGGGLFQSVHVFVVF